MNPYESVSDGSYNRLWVIKIRMDETCSHRTSFSFHYFNEKEKEEAQDNVGGKILDFGATQNRVQIPPPLLTNDVSFDV